MNLIGSKSPVVEFIRGGLFSITFATVGYAFTDTVSQMVSYSFDDLAAAYYGELAVVSVLAFLALTVAVTLKSVVLKWALFAFAATIFLTFSFFENIPEDLISRELPYYLVHGIRAMGLLYLIGFMLNEGAGMTANPTDAADSKGL